MNAAVLALFVLLALLFLFVVGMCALIYFVDARKPRHDPQAFLQRGKRAVSSVVVCAGDSLTHASLSADYVSRLRQRLSSHAYEIVNAGLNGNESTDLLRRIPDIVRCKPDAVSVLIGSNDVRTRFPQEAELAFQTNLNAIVGELRKKNRSAHRASFHTALGRGHLRGSQSGRGSLQHRDSPGCRGKRGGLSAPARVAEVADRKIRHSPAPSFQASAEIIARRRHTALRSSPQLGRHLRAEWLRRPYRSALSERPCGDCDSGSDRQLAEFSAGPHRRRQHELPIEFAGDLTPDRSGLGALCSGGLEWTGHIW
jgi:GDSL-like Lipase/Acylhydrolase family